MSFLTWLHISDWHQTDEKDGTELKRDKVLKALRADIAQRRKLNENLAHIDFVVFSGDIADAGKADEYTAAITRLLDPLLDWVAVERNHLILVPGNHDIEKERIADIPADLQSIPDTRSAVEEWLKDSKKVTTLLGPFESYTNFVKTYLPDDVVLNEIKNPAYGHVRRLDIRGEMKVGVLCLNSSWLCKRYKNSKGRHDDRGHLAVGERQLFFPLDELAGADLCVAVLHHPFDWLMEDERSWVKRKLAENCHFVLYGHEHKPSIWAEASPIGNCVIIPAGASYDRYSEDVQYVPSYNFVCLDIMNGVGTIYMRQWDPIREIWDSSRSYCPPNGEYPFQLPKDLGKGTPLISKSPSPKGFNYLPYLQEWKVVHTTMQTLLDQLVGVVSRVQHCFFLTQMLGEPPARAMSPELENELSLLESDWHRVASMIKGIPAVFKFKYILDEPIVKSLIGTVGNIEAMSRSIGAAHSKVEISAAAEYLTFVKNEMATALTVADRNIVSILDVLSEGMTIAEKPEESLGP
ncbi:MAG TPA: metallophosphoesterase [Chloroflexia bacterium]|jgi:predicted phosphodiesterase